MKFKNLSDRENIIWYPARLSPLLIFTIICIGLLYEIIRRYGFNDDTITFVYPYLLLVYVSSIIINHTTKICMRNFIYKNVNKSIMVLGQGYRPKGAVSCGLTLDNIKSSSFGMPSGHSQAIWLIVSFFIIKMWVTPYNIQSVSVDYKRLPNSNTLIQNNSITSSLSFKISITIILLLIGVYVSLSRVLIEHCHTYRQIIIGGIIGAIIGGVAAYYQPYIFEKLKHYKH